MEGSLVTMAEIAESLQVSVQTVSAVVNGKAGISPATQARVREAIARLDYQPNAQARALRGHPTKTIGVIIPSITNPYFPEFVKGVEAAARAEGYSIFLCNTDAQLTHLLEYFTLIRTNRASGVICCFGPASLWLGDPEVGAWIHRFAKTGVPVVLNGWHGGDLPLRLARVDAESAVREAARRLVALGHQRIGLISPPAGLHVTHERVNAYRSAFAAEGVPLDEALIVPGDFEIEAGAEGARALFARSRPTAIVAPNDLAAFGAISALASMGLRTPADVSVIGFDDIPFARVYQPALTTIRQPVFELGREAFDLAVRPSGEAETVGPTTLSAVFVERDSTGPAP
jgi:DNA-binding LacI/PurR family transcriptional regulator